jgi:hypothetical protein
MHNDPDFDRPPDVQFAQPHKLGDEYAAGDDDGPPAPMGGLLPDQFVTPHNMPVSSEVSGAYDDHGRWWIVQRFETVHGSFVAFMTVPTAKITAAEIDKAVRAQKRTMFVPPSPEAS